jgi:hypothetical protein
MKRLLGICVGLALNTACFADVHISYKQPDLRTIAQELSLTRHEAFVAAITITDPRAIHLLEAAQKRGINVRVVVEQPSSALLDSSLKNIRQCLPGEIRYLRYQGVTLKAQGLSIAGSRLTVEGLPKNYGSWSPLGSILALDNIWEWHGPLKWSSSSWQETSWGASHGFFNEHPLSIYGLEAIWNLASPLG